MDGWRAASQPHPDGNETGRRGAAHRMAGASVRSHLSRRICPVTPVQAYLSGHTYSVRPSLLGGQLKGTAHEAGRRGAAWRGAARRTAGTLCWSKLDFFSVGLQWQVFASAGTGGEGHIP
eukprot:360928-Chlamydomonas_euryale.AAC.8